MQNAKSTIAMRLAHKIHAKWPKSSFGTCLKYAWKIVRIDMTIAQRIILGTYKIKLNKERTVFGVAYGIRIVERGFLKRLFCKDIVTNITRWEGFKL